METVILDNLPFPIDTDALIRRLLKKRGSTHVEDLTRLTGEAQSIARPKALYRVRYVKNRGDDYVVVGGVRLTSRVLRVNLEHAHRVFPYVATCGVELAAWASSQDDLLHRFWAEAISEVALRQARRAAHKHLVERYRPGQVSSMAPGSLADWPLEEQRGLFVLLGDTEDTVGVHLTDSMLMIPIKSASGIWFPAEASFESCQLCPRDRCPGRRAPYDVGLYERKYGKRAQ